LRWWRGPVGAGPCVLAFLLTVAPVDAAVTDYTGKPIAEVRLQSSGVEFQDPTLLEIIETRVGSALAMQEVRESMAHLFGLGLYQDVQVDATLRGDGVVLTYNLFPVLRIRRVVFEGALAISESDIRRVVTERYGATLSLARANQAAGTLRTLYRDRGYPDAEIAVRADTARDASNAAMVFTIQSGARARIGAIDVQGAPHDPAPQLLAELDLHPGTGYDGVALDRRLLEYAEELRQDGYYEARVSQLPRYVEGASIVNLVLTVEPGPRVEVVFQGDVLGNSEREELVPIAREHSVAEDLLEDSKFGIERHFRERGYCVPRADYQRGEVAGVLRITFTITRGPQCTVDRADVSGNASISAADLAPLILTKTGESFNDATVAGDVARLRAIYLQRGFSTVKVASQIDRRETRPGVALVGVTYAIAEGLRSTIQSVSFEGNTAIDAETLRKAVATAPGQPYFDPQVIVDADSLALLYLNLGYREITVRPDAAITRDGSAVDLRFIIHEGPQILIDHVLIVGNDRTRRDTILREVQLKSGQPLSQQHEDETRARLTGLGLFRRVDISYLQLPSEPLHRDVVITIEEAPATTIDYGGGLEGGERLIRSAETSDAEENFQFAPRGFFQVSRRNLFGKDRSLTLFTRVSFRPQDADFGEGYGVDEYLARLTYSERRVFGTDADATVSAGVEQGVRSSFDFIRRGGSASITKRISRALAVGVQYGIDETQRIHIRSDLDEQPEIDRLFPEVRLSSVTGSLIRDSRNDLIQPTTGHLISTEAELAARGIGSEVGFIKTFLQGFTYRQLPGSSGIVAVLGARVGLATGLQREVFEEGRPLIVVDDLPASERFYAGGDSTVRGFALDRLGIPFETIDAKDFPTGGNGLVVLNLELRIPIRGVLGAVLFTDGGNVFRRVKDMDFAELRGTAGFGLRYQSPVGPIRVDLGIKLDRQFLPSGKLESPTAFHISLGQAF